MSLRPEHERKGRIARPPRVLRIQSSGECYAVTFGAQIYAEVTGAAPLALYRCTNSEAVSFHRKQGGGSEDLHEISEEGCAFPGAVFAAEIEKDNWVRVAGGTMERWFPQAANNFQRLDNDVSKRSIELQSCIGESSGVTRVSEVSLAWHPCWELVSWQAIQGMGLKPVIAGFEWGAEAVLVHDPAHSRFLRIGTKRSSKPGVVLGDIQVSARSHDLVAAARSAAAASGDAVLVTKPLIGVSWGSDTFDASGLLSDAGYVSAASSTFTGRHSDRELENHALETVQQTLVAEVRGWFSPRTSSNFDLLRAATRSSSALRVFWSHTLRDRRLFLLWEGLRQLPIPKPESSKIETSDARTRGKAVAKDNPFDPMSIWVQMTLGSVMELALCFPSSTGGLQHMALERIITRATKSFAASRPLSLCNTGSVSDICIRETVVALETMINDTPELKPAALDMVLTLATAVGSAKLVAHALLWLLQGADDDCAARCQTSVSSLWQLGSAMHFEKCVAPRREEKKRNQQSWQFIPLSSCSRVAASPVWLRSYRLLSFDDVPNGVYWEVTVFPSLTSSHDSLVDLGGVSIGLWLTSRKKPLVCCLADGSALGPGVQAAPVDNIPRHRAGGIVFGFTAKSEELIVSCNGSPFSSLTYAKFMSGERVAVFVEHPVESRVFINLGQEPVVHQPVSRPVLWGTACDPFTNNPYVPFDKPPQTVAQLVHMLFRITKRNVEALGSFLDNAAFVRHTFSKTEHMEIAEDGSVVSSTRERSWARVDCEISVGMSVDFSFEILDDRENDEGTCYGLSTVDCNKYDSRGSFCLRAYNGHLYCDSSDAGAKFPKIHPGSTISFRFDYSEGKLEASLNDSEPCVLVDDPAQFAGRTFYPTVFNYHGTRTKVRLNMCNTCGSLRASMPDPFVLEVTNSAVILWISILEQLLVRFQAAPVGGEDAKQVSAWITAALHVWLAVADVSPESWFDIGDERCRLKEIIEYIVIERSTDPFLIVPRAVGILLISALGVGTFFGDLEKVLQVFLQIHDSRKCKLSQTLASFLLETTASAALSAHLVARLCKLAFADELCCQVLMRLTLNAFADGASKFQIFAHAILDLVNVYREHLVPVGSIPLFISDMLPILAQLLAAWPSREPCVLPTYLELLKPVMDTQSALRFALSSKRPPKHILDAIQGFNEFICSVAKILLAPGQPFPLDIGTAELRDNVAAHPLPEELEQAKTVVDEIAGSVSIQQLSEPALPCIVAEILTGAGQGEALVCKLHQVSSCGEAVISDVQRAAFAVAVLCKGPKLWNATSADAVNPTIQRAWREARLFRQCRVLSKKRSLASSGGDVAAFEANIASLLTWLARSIVWPSAILTRCESSSPKIPMVERMRQLGRMYAVDNQTLSAAGHDLSKAQAQLVDEAAKVQSGSDALYSLAAAASLQRDVAVRRWLAFRLLRHLLRESKAKKIEDDPHEISDETSTDVAPTRADEIVLLIPALQGALEECLANPLAGLSHGGISLKHSALCELRGLLGDICEVCTRSSTPLIAASGLLMLCVPLPREELDPLLSSRGDNLMRLALDTTGAVSWCRAHAAQLVLRMYIAARGCNTPIFLALIAKLVASLEPLSAPTAELPCPSCSCADPLAVDWDFGAFGRLCPRKRNAKASVSLNDLRIFRVLGKFSPSLAASLLLRLPCSTGAEASIDPLDVAHAMHAECSETAATPMKCLPGACSAVLTAEWPTKCLPGACAAAMTLLRPVANILTVVEPGIVDQVLKVVSSGERFPASLAACFYAALRNHSKTAGGAMPCAQVPRAEEQQEAHKLLELLGEARQQAIVRDRAANTLHKRGGSVAFAVLLASKLRQVMSQRSAMIEVVQQALAGAGSYPTCQALAAITLLGGSKTCVACHMHVVSSSFGPSLVIGADAKHVAVLKLESGGDAKSVQFIPWAARQALPRQFTSDIARTGLAGEGVVCWGQSVTKSLLAAVHDCLAEDRANQHITPQLLRALTAVFPSAPCWDAAVVKQVLRELAQLAAVGVGDAVHTCSDILEDHCMLLRLALQHEESPSSVWQHQPDLVSSLDPTSWKPPMLRILNQGHAWQGSCKFEGECSKIELWFTFQEEGLLDVAGKLAHRSELQSGQNSKWYHVQGDGISLEFDMEVHRGNAEQDHVQRGQVFTWRGHLINSMDCPHFEGSASGKSDCFVWYCVPPDPFPLAQATDLNVFGQSKHRDAWDLNLPKLQAGLDEHQMEEFCCSVGLAADSLSSSCTVYDLAKTAVDGLHSCKSISGPCTIAATKEDTAAENWGLCDSLDQDNDESANVVSEITGRVGSYVDNLEFLMQDGTKRTYGGDTGGEPVGPWTLQPDEYIVAVEQGDHSHGALGTCLILETSRGTTISIAGNADESVHDARIRKEAPWGSQVIGLVFERSKLTELLTSVVGHHHRKAAQIKFEVLGGGTCVRPPSELIKALEDEEQQLRHSLLMQLLQTMLLHQPKVVTIGESFPGPEPQEAFFRWAVRLPDPRSVLLDRCAAEFADSPALVSSALKVAMEGILAPFMTVTVALPQTRAAVMKFTLPGVEKTCLQVQSAQTCDKSDTSLELFGQCDSQGRLSSKLHQDDKLLVSRLHKEIHVQGDHVWMKCHPGDPKFALEVRFTLKGQISASGGSGNGSSGGYASALPFRAALRLLEAIAHALPEELSLRAMCCSVLLTIAAWYPLSDEASWGAEAMCKLVPRQYQWSESGWYTALKLMRVADASGSKRFLASLVALLSAYSPPYALVRSSETPCMLLRCTLPSTRGVILNGGTKLLAVGEEPVVGVGCPVFLVPWPKHTLFRICVEWATEDIVGKVSVGLANVVDHSIDAPQIESLSPDVMVWCDVSNVGQPGELLNVQLLRPGPLEAHRSMQLVVSGSLGLEWTSLPLAWSNSLALTPLLTCEGFGCSASLLPPPSMPTSLQAAASRLAQFQQTLHFAEVCRKSSKAALPSELISGAWLLQQAGSESSISAIHDKMRDRATATAESDHPHKWDPVVQKLEIPGANAIELTVPRLELAEGYRLHVTLDEAGKLPIKVPHAVHSFNLLSYPHRICGSTPLSQSVDMTPEYEISFDLKPHSKMSGLTSILRFTMTDQDNSDSECDRIPAFFFCSGTTQLSVRQDRPGHSNEGFDSKDQLPLGRTTHIKTVLRGKTLAVYFDDVLQGESCNYTTPLAARRGAKVWVGDQFHEPADATIDNLVFHSVLPQDIAASCTNATELSELTPDVQVTVPSSTVYVHGPVPKVPQWDAEWTVDWSDNNESEADEFHPPVLCAGPWTWVLSPEHQVTLCLTPSGGVALTSSSLEMMTAAEYDEARGIMIALGESVIQPNVGWVDPDKFRLANVRGSWDVVNRQCLSLTLEGTDDLGTAVLKFSSGTPLRWENDVVVVSGDVLHERWGQHSVVCNGETQQAGKVCSIWKRPDSHDLAVEVQILGTSEPATAHAVHVSAALRSVAAPEVPSDSQIQQSLILDLGEHVEKVNADVGSNERPFRFIVRTNRGRSISWPVSPPSGTPLIEYAPPAYCEVTALSADVFTGSKKFMLDRAFRPLDLVRRGRPFELQSLPEGLWDGSLTMDGRMPCDIGLEITAGSSRGSFAACFKPLDASADSSAAERGAAAKTSLHGELSNSGAIRAFYTSDAASLGVNLEGRCVIDHQQRVVMILASEVQDDLTSEEQPRMRMILRSHASFSSQKLGAGAMTIDNASLIFCAHCQTLEYAMRSAASPWTQQVAMDGLFVAAVAIQHLSSDNDGSGLILGLGPAQQPRPEPLSAWPGTAKKMRWLWRGDGCIVFHAGSVGIGKHQRSVYKHQCDRWRFGAGDVAGFALGEADISFLKNGDRVHTVPRHAHGPGEPFAAEGNPSFFLGVRCNAAVELCGGLQYPLLHQDLELWQKLGTKMHASRARCQQHGTRRITLRHVALALIWLSRLIRVAFKGWLLWKHDLPDIARIVNPVEDSKDEDVWIEATATGTEGSFAKGTTIVEYLGGEDALKEQLSKFVHEHHAQGGTSSAAVAVEIGEVFINQLGPADAYIFTDAVVSAYCKSAATEHFSQFSLKRGLSGWAVTDMQGELSGKRNLCEGMHIRPGEEVTILAVDGDWLHIEGKDPERKTLWFPTRYSDSAQCRFIRKRDFTFNQVPVAWSIGTVHLEDWVTPESLEGNIQDLPVGNSAYTVEASVRVDACASDTEMCLVAWGDDSGPCTKGLAVLDQAPATASGSLKSADRLQDGHWHHIACTFDGRERRLWSNFQLVASDTPSLSDKAECPDCSVQDNFAFGAYPAGLAAAQGDPGSFHGDVRHLRIWKTVLGPGILRANALASESPEREALCAEAATVLFKCLDANEDGCVSLADLEVIFGGRCDHFLRHLHQNAEGLSSLEDWLSFWKKMHQYHGEEHMLGILRACVRNFMQRRPPTLCSSLSLSLKEVMARMSPSSRCFGWRVLAKPVGVNSSTVKHLSDIGFKTFCRQVQVVHSLFGSSLDEAIVEIADRVSVLRGNHDNCWLKPLSVAEWSKANQTWIDQAVRHYKLENMSMEDKLQQVVKWAAVSGSSCSEVLSPPSSSPQVQELWAEVQCAVAAAVDRLDMDDTRSEGLPRSKFDSESAEIVKKVLLWLGENRSVVGSVSRIIGDLGPSAVESVILFHKEPGQGSPYGARTSGAGTKVSWNLEPKEFITAVSQGDPNVRHLGSCLVFETTHRSYQLQAIEGSTSPISVRFEAAAGEQIYGLVFDGSRLTGVETCAAVEVAAEVTVDILFRRVAGSMLFYRFLVLLELNRNMSRDLLPLLDLAAPAASANGTLLAALKPRLFGHLKFARFQRVLESTKVDGGATPHIMVNRKMAAALREKDRIDWEFKRSVLAQLMVECRKNSKGPKLFRRLWQSRCMRVSFKGEGGEDAGGLYREALDTVAQELHSKALPLFVPCPNSIHDVGDNRDAWIFNPRATAIECVHAFEFVGQLLGLAIRTGDLLPLSLAPFTWKGIIGDERTRDDVRSVDVFAEKDCDAEKHLAILGSNEGGGCSAGQGSAEVLAAMGGLQFVYPDVTGEEVELVEGGRGVDITLENAHEFVRLLLQSRLNHDQLQLQALTRGMATVVPVQLLRLWSWQDLQERVCGAPEVDLENLKRHTQYRSCSSTNKHVGYLWAALQSFTPKQQRSFLRFVWGRSSLPTVEKWEHNFTVHLVSCSDDSRLPSSHTCVFSLELPTYSSEEVCRAKLLYCITNCLAIDSDGNAARSLNWDEDDWD